MALSAGSAGTEAVVARAAQSIAASHSRVMVLEVMGRDAGFIAACATLGSQEVNFTHDGRPFFHYMSRAWIVDRATFNRRDKVATETRASAESSPMMLRSSSSMQSAVLFRHYNDEMPHLYSFVR